MAGVGWRPSPAGPGSCGAALRAQPLGTALPPLHQGRSPGENSSAMLGPAKAPGGAGMVTPVQFHPLGPGPGANGSRASTGPPRALPPGLRAAAGPGRGQGQGERSGQGSDLRERRGKAKGPGRACPQAEQDSVSPSTAEGGSLWGRAENVHYSNSRKQTVLTGHGGPWARGLLSGSCSSRVGMGRNQEQFFS